MTHSETSLKTKKKLAASLKKLMMVKSLRRITVTDIVKDCGVNRKTFYYHFEDIYDLMKWILEQEAVEIVKEFDLITDYKEAALFVINYIEENAHILNCAYDAIGQEGMKRFLYQDFIDIIKKTITEGERKEGIYLEQKFKEFLCNFYANSCAAMLVSWFRDPGGQSKEEMVEYLHIIIQSSLPEILKNSPGAISIERKS